MNRLFKYSLNFLVILSLGLGLSGCVTTTRLPVENFSPWQEIELSSNDNPLDISFIDENHGFSIENSGATVRDFDLNPCTCES